MVDHSNKTYAELLEVIRLLETQLIEERKLVQELRRRLNDCHDGILNRPTTVGSWLEEAQG